MNPINEEIITLWNQYFSEDEEVYAPLLYGNFKTESLLFVGINPSFSTHAHKSIFKDTTFANLDTSDYFKWKNVAKSPELINTCIEGERISFERHSYFKIMRLIAEKLSVPCEHVDIFLYKLTSQEEFKKLIYSDGKLNQFATDQLEIFDEVLTAVNPRVIVIANAHGAEIINDYFSGRIEFDDSHGYHHITLVDQKKVPIFFSSMVSGQRSLDIWSRQRLQWHIGQALKETQ
jgi:hypothetical protein